MSCASVTFARQRIASAAAGDISRANLTAVAASQGWAGSLKALRPPKRLTVTQGQHPHWLSLQQALDDSNGRLSEARGRLQRRVKQQQAGKAQREEWTVRVVMPQS